VERRDMELRIEQPGRAGQRWDFLSQGKVVPANPSGARVDVALDRIVEAALPFDLLGVKVDQPVQFYVEVLESQQSRDRAPREGTIHLTCPSPDFERIM